MIAHVLQAFKVTVIHYNYINNYYYNSLLLLMASKNTFACKDNRPQYREENMEVDAPAEQVEQVEEQPKEPEAEKPVSCYGCPSE